MDDFDVIVVGARCAGAPTAMLMARRGYRVLVVDRAAFPSDTLSTLVIHAPGVASLRRWGLLGRLVATGCPPIDRYVVDFGPVVIDGTPRPCDGISTAYAPRRTVLDMLLVGAAREAGADVREGFTVDGNGRLRTDVRQRVQARAETGSEHERRGGKVRRPRRAHAPLSKTMSGPLSPNSSRY